MEKHKQISRREFIVGSLAAAASFAIPESLESLDSPQPNIDTLAKFSGNAIMKRGQDPTAALINEKIYYAGAVGTGINIVSAESVPELSRTDILNPQQQAWQASEKDIGKDTSIWKPTLYPDRNEITIYGSTYDGDISGFQRIFAIGADSMEDEFHFLGYLNTGHDWSIDGSRFNYRGTDFFVWSGKDSKGGGSNQNLLIAEMKNAHRLTNNISIISKPEYEWEAFSPSQKINEAPLAYIPSTDTEPILVFSAAGSWTQKYCLGRLSLVGDDPLNPKHWHKHPEPIFKKFKTIYGPGSHCIVRDKIGVGWLIYNNKITPWPNWKRQVRAQKINFDENGLPVFGRPSYSYEQAYL